MISEEALEVWLSLALDTGDGPWDWDSRGKFFEVTDSKSLLVAQCESRKEAMFISESRTAIPLLIAEVRRLKAQLSDAVSQGFYHGKTIMEDKVVQLEKEADWLAEKLTSSFCLSRQVKYKKMCKGCELYDFGSPIEGETRGLMSNHSEQAKKCWREAARKAVEE